MSNIPIAYFVDTVGRKSSMIAGLLFSSAGLGLVGVSLTPGVPVLPWLMSCRLINGVGVSAFIAGAQLFAADVSTNLNRAKTFAPLNIAFQLGFTIGPMVGAFGISQLGIPMTFASCGTALASVAVYNHFAVTETLVRSTTSAPSSSCVNKQPDDMSRTANASEEISSAFRAAYSSWGQLLKNTGVRDISLVTGAYWFALSGVQFTILPQLFILPEFQLTAVGISCIYMTMSSTQFLSASKIAQFADHSGKPPVIFAGGAMMTAALVGLPFADSFMGLIGVSVPLALGATVLSVIPHSLLIDMVSVRDQAQAQSLLRTCGDIGMLTGSITTGLMMSVFNTENAIMVNTAIVAASMGYYAKEYILNKGTVPVVTRDMERRTENSIDAQAQDSGKQRNSNEEFDMHRPKLVMKQQTDEKEFIEPRFRHDS
jgi:MFS family permease